MKNKTTFYKHWIARLILMLAWLSVSSSVPAQTAEFTYQGRLTVAGNLADGMYDIRFKLFDTPDVDTGAQQGATLTRPTVQVMNGVFTVQLDFGAGVFNGSARYLEISIRPSGNLDPHIILGPRQAITSSPYAIKSLTAATADALTAACVNCVSSSQIVSVNGNAVTGVIPVASVPAGSASYIQNRPNQQASSNFNISGNGTANVLNAVTQFNIGGNRVLSIAGMENTFVGIGTGESNTTGFRNAFFGFEAGKLNAEGFGNAFFGHRAGANNRAIGGPGSNYNSFFGDSAGLSNTIGDFNNFFGSSAGNDTTTGFGNCFFGSSAGFSNTTGSSNTSIGNGAGSLNIIGSSITTIGAGANVGSGNLNHATAIGAGAVVDSNNTIVLGRSDGSDFVRIPGLLTIPNLAVAGSEHLCRNSFDRVGSCSSSLRYKTDLTEYSDGLDIINRLRPITFTWKDGGMRDLGFGAEEVEKIEPLLVTYNKQGQVEGVKYDRINVVLVNAIKEQHIQISRQQERLEQQHEHLTQQQSQIEALKKLVCATNPTAELCRK